MMRMMTNEYEDDGDAGGDGDGDVSDGDAEGGDDEGNTDDGDFSRDRSSCSKSRGGYTAVGRSTNSDTSKVPARYLREILNS